MKILIRYIRYIVNSLIGIFVFSSSIFSNSIHVSGRIITTQVKPVKNALVKFIEAADTSSQFSILTDSSGYYSLLITGVSSPEEIIQSFQLHQNYPNPFCDFTTISYQLQKSSFVKITIYDILGRRVKTIISKKQLPGFYNIFWDGTNQSEQRVSSGMYFYQIRTHEKIVTQKMIYLPQGGVRLSTNPASLFKIDKSVFKPELLISYNVIIDNTPTTHPRIVPFSQLGVEIVQDTVLNFQVAEKVGTWEFLGLEDKYASRLVLAEPYLYVCAEKDGLWRKNIRDMSEDWEYVGLADTVADEYLERIVDVLIHWQNKDWLLATYFGKDGSDHGIYRSFDDGKTWAPADSGLEFYYGGDRYFYRINRFFQYPEHIVGAGHSAYITLNFGDWWQEAINPIGHENIDALICHPEHSNIIWLGGSGSTWTTLLGFSKDSGYTWTRINLPGIFQLGSISSIAFDILDTNIVYASWAYGIIKTIDGGVSWDSLTTFNVRKLLSDPQNRFHLWASYQSGIIETWDEGITWLTNESPYPEMSSIRDMIWDEKETSIYLGTKKGVYRYKP